MFPTRPASNSISRFVFRKRPLHRLHKVVSFVRPDYDRARDRYVQRALAGVRLVLKGMRACIVSISDLNLAHLATKVDTNLL